MEYIDINVINFRRRVEFDLVESPLSELSDDDLLELVKQLQQDNLDVGESMTVGLIRSRGFKVSRACIRNALRASDPLSTALRWPGVITSRHVYSVAGPNSLWHIGIEHLKVEQVIVSPGQKNLF